MKILMLSWRDPWHPKAGGAEVYTYEILMRLAQSGHEITWFSARYRGFNPKKYNGIRFVYGGWSLLVYVSGLLYSLLHPSFDVYIDQINGLGFGIPWIYPRRTVALIHQTITDIWKTYPYPISTIGAVMERFVLSCYQNTPFVTVSRSTFREMRSLGWAREGQIIPVGVPIISTRPKTPYPSVCFLGRLNAPTKRLSLAISTFRQVKLTIPDAILHVIGRGQVLADWKHEGIIFHENASTEERNQLLAESWCLLVTSVREGWGMMITEAAAAGTPTIALDAPGVRDAVKNTVTGLIGHDVPQLQGQLQKVLSNPEHFESMGKVARDFALALSWDASAHMAEEFLLNVLCRPNPGRPLSTTMEDP